MDSLNLLRAILVAGAALAAVVAAFNGQWLTFGILAVGIAGHGLLWRHLRAARDTRPPIIQS